MKKVIHTKKKETSHTDIAQRRMNTKAHVGKEWN